MYIKGLRVVLMSVRHAILPVREEDAKLSIYM